MKHFQGLTRATALVLGGLLGLAAAATAADKAEDRETRFRGTLTRVQPAERQLTVKNRDGRELTFTLEERSKVMVDGREASLDRLKVGDGVVVQYEARGDRKAVVSVRNTPALDVLKRQGKEFLQSLKAYGYQQRDEYMRKLEATLVQMDEHIQDLKEQARQAGADAQQRYAKELEELRRKREDVQARLAKAKEASPQAWEDIKSGANAALDDLQKALERARSRFDQDR